MKGKHLLAAAFLIVAGCKKDNVLSSTNFKGTWELESVQSSWFGHTDYEPGNGNTIQFDGRSYITTYKSADTTYSFSGKFEVFKDKPCEFAPSEALISFDKTNPSVYSFSDGELTIGTTQCIADGGSSTYRKIK